MSWDKAFFETEWESFSELISSRELFHFAQLVNYRNFYAIGLCDFLVISTDETFVWYVIFSVSRYLQVEIISWSVSNDF